ncbi:hypothetical protein AAG747_15065 [Rapidithrix thailandica]|uniref:Uncharacterized protein n=1 Tax=Rapidithrix thailandica TaxID=413964 RepID=A0AAW9SD08_9BACT
MDKERYYSHSGDSPFPGFLLAIGLSISLAIILGKTYQILNCLITEMYFQIFITLGFGLLIGFGSVFFSKIGYVRNNSQKILIAAIASVAGWYFQWIAYISYVYDNDLSIVTFNYPYYWFYLRHPSFILQSMLAINETGLWTFEGMPFKGIVLGIVWLLEAALLVGTAISVTVQYPITPFSENLKKWYRKYTLKFKFEPIHSKEEFTGELFKNPEELISQMGPGDKNEYSRISIYYLPEEEETHYLSVDNITKGYSNKISIKVIHLYKIDTHTAQSLLGKFQFKTNIFNLFHKEVV